MKANIKLHGWIPFIFIIVVVFFLMQEFNLLDIVMIVGGSIIVGYFVMGFIRRKDALVIDGDTMIVTTPIKKKTYTISDMTELLYHPKDKGILQAKLNGETINLCTDIYDQELCDIVAYLLSHYDHLKMN
jgi:hypothetical protein